MTIQHQAAVLWNTPVGKDCFHLGLSCPRDYQDAQPGQFVMLQVDRPPAPLLRRPFSLHGLMRKDGQVQGIEVLYKVVGQGTAQLSRCRAGQVLDVIGPLGRGFRVPPAAHHIYLAAGGIGVAPIVFLASELIDKGMSPHDCRLFLGGQSAQDLLCRQAFEQLHIQVEVSTDDGSAGNQCLLTHPLELAIEKRRPDMVFACGPHGMLTCVADMARKFDIECQLSVETVMACGMGACLGCAVKKSAGKDGYWHVCMNGPVFDARQIQW